MDDQLFLTYRELAAALHCSPRTIQQRVAEGKIPVRRVGRTPLVPAWWLHQYAESAPMPKAEQPHHVYSSERYRPIRLPTRRGQARQG